MRIDEFKTNPELETEGAWVEIGEGAELRIARQGNPKWKEYVRRRLKPYKRLVRADRLPDDIAEGITVDALVHTVLLDWRGLKDADGVEIPYSVEKAKELLSAPEYRDFRELVEEISGEREAFREIDLEDAEGN